MSLFGDAGDALRRRQAPLAERMRPRTLAEFVGQDHIVGRDRPLRRALEADFVPNMILFGPPGTGKTTLARVIAAQSRAEFVGISAISAGVADLRKIIAEARERLDYYQRRTILFVDEIHRFNKAQQDAVLPYVEDGTLTLIGATTENPYFEVSKALLSRCRLFPLKPLDLAALAVIVSAALSDVDRGLGAMRCSVDQDALEHLLRLADGDARVALNVLELAAMGAENTEGGRRITLKTMEEALQVRALKHDRAGDAHYDTVSAWIKSMRGSDPDAALYWLARLIEGGETPRFIARRLLIHAAEDVGLADPQALLVAAAAAQAAEIVGWPEARIPLAEATLYVALAEKSNSVVRSIDTALERVRHGGEGEVPAHLRDASYAGAASLGHGLGYLYPHDYPRGWVAQEYLPDGVAADIYSPGERGVEAELLRLLEHRRGGDGCTSGG